MKTIERMKQTDNPRLYSPLTLAHLGDAVYELLVREHVCDQSMPAHTAHKKTVAMVRCQYQAQVYDAIYDGLTEEEQDIMRRGRNSSTVKVPKNAGCMEYRKATGFEAVLGYLYITGRTERLAELLTKAAAAVKEEETCQRQP